MTDIAINFLKKLGTKLTQWIFQLFRVALVPGKKLRGLGFLFVCLFSLSLFWSVAGGTPVPGASARGSFYEEILWCVKGSDLSRV